MNLEILRATIDFFCSHQDEIEFIWHGGEPLLAGMEFYRKAAELQKTWESRGKRITNFIQTNGTLIDIEWTSLFAELGFHVGVSLDAPPTVHNNLRVNDARSSNIKKILRGISHLQKYGILNGVSCCIGRKNCDKPEEIINFFLECGIKTIKFLRIKGNDQETIPAGQYADFLIQVFNIWLKLDDPDLEIRDIKSIVNLLLGGEFRECLFMGRCDQFATVYSDGSIFTCDSFLNKPHLRFGTVCEPYSKVIKRDSFKAFLTTMEKAKEPCKKCRWYSLCGGGCLKDRVDNEKNETCKANQKLFEEIETSLKSYGLLTY